MSSRKELLKIYKKIGIKKGDIIFVHSRLFSFGKLADKKEEIIKFFLNPLLEAIGYPEGTVVVLTYTFRYGSHKESYIHEETPSGAGMLTNYVRGMKGSVRSFHPLVSCAAIGKKKKEICGNITRAAFGWGSVFNKLHLFNAKCLYLGMRLGESCSFLHYVEQMYGVSHCYNKAFFYPAYKKGKLRKGPFLAFLRDRKSQPFDYSLFQEHLRKKKMIKEARYKNAPIQLVRFSDCFDEGIKILDKNPCCFIGAPFYITK